VQSQGVITYRAETPLGVIFDGGICEGKATLVLRGRGAVVDGLVFENLRVPDGNGAGIRIEKGTLAVSRSLFRNSEQGILSASDDPTIDVTIERSTFSRLGRCDRGLSCAHSVYLAGIRSVTVRYSRFEKGSGGHYLKSRSAMIDVTDSSFDDSQGRTTNYMIDLPGGARGRIERNVFVQGADKENHSAFITVASEGQQNSSVNLRIAGNDAHMARGATWPSALLADRSGTPKQIVDNRIDSRIKPVAEIEAPGFTTRVKDRLRYYLSRLIG
jgi:hypothetical protein